MWVRTLRVFASHPVSKKLLLVLGTATKKALGF
jgi:hypothetical protein